MSEVNDTQTSTEKEVINLDALSADELKKMQWNRDADDDNKIITDTAEVVRKEEEKEESENPSEYNVEIITKPKEGEEEIKVDGEQSVAKVEDGKEDGTKPELTYEQFTQKYPDLKDKVDETKFNEMFKVEAPETKVEEKPVEYQKVTIDTADEVALTNLLDKNIREDAHIKAILAKAGLKEFPKTEDEMDAFAEAFPRAYIQFEQRQSDIAEDVTKNYIRTKEIQVNAPIIRSKNIEGFGNLVEEDVRGLYPDFEKDKDTLKKVKDALLSCYAKAKNDSRYGVNVGGQLIPSKEKLYTGFTMENRGLFREVAQKGATTVAKAGDGKKIMAEIKKQVKASPMTTLQDSVKSSGGNNSKVVNVMDDNEITTLSTDTLKAMRKKMQSKL